MYFYTPSERSSGGYIGITLSVRLSIHPSVCRFVSGPLLFFGLTLVYHIWHMGLAPCDKYIHVPDLMLTFFLKVNFIGFCHFFMYTLQPLSLDIDIPSSAHGPFTMRGCVKYIHDPDMTLTFDLKVQFIGFMTWFCVQASAFLSFDIVILECITMVRCVMFMYIYELCMTLTDDLNITNIFSTWICQDVLSLWHRHTKF